jgi:hypothetical protein
MLLPTCSISHVARASVIGVELAAESVPPNTALFGTTKCTSADQPGRWLNLDVVGGACKAPYCTGPSETMLYNYDWVRG